MRWCVLGGEGSRIGRSGLASRTRLARPDAGTTPRPTPLPAALTGSAGPPLPLPRVAPRPRAVCFGAASTARICVLNTTEPGTTGSGTGASDGRLHCTANPCLNLKRAARAGAQTGWTTRLSCRHQVGLGGLRHCRHGWFENIGGNLLPTAAALHFGQCGRNQEFNLGRQLIPCVRGMQGHACRRLVLPVAQRQQLRLAQAHERRHIDGTNRRHQYEVRSWWFSIMSRNTICATKVTSCRDHGLPR